MYSLNLKTDERAPLVTDLRLKNVFGNLNLFQIYKFDTLNYNIDKHLQDLRIHVSLDTCNLDREYSIYLVDCNTFEFEGIYYTIEYTPTEKILINTDSLFNFRASYKTIVNAASIYPNVYNDLVEYLYNYENSDVLLEFLCKFNEEKLYTKLFTQTDTVENLEALVKLPTYSAEQYEQKLNFINDIIERQNLQDEDIVYILSHVRIKPTLYLDRITDDMCYYELARMYPSLRNDTSRLYSSKASVYWCMDFGDVNILEANITESKYAYMYCKYVRDSELCRSKISTPQEAYKYALNYVRSKKDNGTIISSLRDIVLNSTEYYIGALFAKNIDNLSPDSTTLFSLYVNNILNSDNKGLYFYADSMPSIIESIPTTSTSIIELLYSNPNTYENQGWIISFLTKFQRYLDSSITGFDLFDRIEHPVHLYLWAFHFNTNISECLSRIISYASSNPEDISHVIFNWFNSFGYESSLIPYLTNSYWKAKSEHLLGTIL